MLSTEGYHYDAVRVQDFRIVCFNEFSSSEMMRANCHGEEFKELNLIPVTRMRAETPLNFQKGRPDLCILEEFQTLSRSSKKSLEEGGVWKMKCHHTLIFCQSLP